MLAIGAYHHLIDICLVFLSSLLLVFSFPSFDLGGLAWVSLLPLLLAISGKSQRYGFFLSTVCGIFFFMGIFNWILEVPKYNLLHHAMLALYMGSYFGLFGLAFNFLSMRCGLTPALFATPFIWVSLEYIRSNLSFLALPWGLLGHSQYQHPSVIQISSLAGTYSVSFLIVLFNSAVAAIVLPLVFRLKKGKATHLYQAPSKKAILTLVVTASTLTTLALLYGFIATSKPIAGRQVKVSVVQGNIEQAKKWDQRYARDIMQIYADLTQEASQDRPALIVWPETATPGAINLEPGLSTELRSISRKASTYLLLGSAEHQKFEKPGVELYRYFNSAFLILPGSEPAKTQRYDKIRLFPFGEYLPFREIIPWSLINVPDSGHYTSGKKFTLFELPAFRFGVTICWENVFPDLVRQFVRQGAQFMINITNEARFGKTAAPYQSLSMSVFRAVENRVFVVRCANTGVSCFIDPYGRVVARVRDNTGKDIFVRGVLSRSVIPQEFRTFYTEHGDLLAQLSLPCSVVFLLFAFIRNKRYLNPTSEKRVMRISHGDIK